MIPPFLHFHAVLKKSDGIVHRVMTASGFPTKEKAVKHLEDSTGDKVVSTHPSYEAAQAAASTANDAQTAPEGEPIAPIVPTV